MPVRTRRSRTISPPPLEKGDRGGFCVPRLDLPVRLFSPRQRVPSEGHRFVIGSVCCVRHGHFWISGACLLWQIDLFKVSAGRDTSRMLKNEPPRAQRTAKKTFRFPLSTKPQTFGALGGLCGSSLSLKLEFQQPPRCAVEEWDLEASMCDPCS